MKQQKKGKKLLQLKGFLSFLILHELKANRLSGEALALKVGRRKGNRLTPGTIYPALKNLRSLGLVDFTSEGRRKVYFLTKKGELELRSLYSQFSRYFQGLKKEIRREYAKDNRKYNK